MSNNNEENNDRVGIENPSSYQSVFGNAPDDMMQKYNLFGGGAVMPKMVKCPECHASCKPSRASITYGNRRVFVQNLCDECLHLKELEGKEMTKKWREEIEKKEKEIQQVIKQKNNERLEKDGL